MSAATKTYQAIRAHVSGEYSTGTLHGKEYIVVPVVALVEGVIQGMAAEGPELALADEFGRFSDSWNGRPIVMSHPVVNKKPVSANSPSILEDYQIGFAFNASLDGDKLILEAWVDPTVMESLNDDSKEILALLQAGTMIEVSTGYFAQLEKTPGLYNNTKYDAVQRNVVPDHLAFLPNGTIGACSIADGCGAQLAVNAKSTDTFQVIKTFYAPQACCDACASGGSHTHGDEMPAANKNASEEAKPAARQDPKAYESVATTLANTIAGGVTLSDARDAVSASLKAEGNTYAYILAMTTEVVVYEQYNNFVGMYETYQRSYSVSVDGVVTLGDTVEKVRLMTKVVTVNADGTSPEDNPEQNMTDKTNDGAATAASTTAANTETVNLPKVHKVENDQGTLEVTVNEKGEPTGFKLTPKAPIVQAAKPAATVEEFVAQAPKEMQEVLNSSIKLHQEKKDTTIKALKDSGRCKFDDNSLKAMSLDTLENLAELANVPVSYGGRALPIANSQEEQNFTAAPMVFEAPKLVTDNTKVA